jgi:hypothetical protein
VHAVEVENEMLTDLLNAIDVDEGEDEDGVGAVGKLSDSSVKK